jgi:gas vesicle protein
LRFARDFKRISRQLEDAIEQGKNSTDDFEEDYTGVAADFQAYINQQQGTESMGLLKRLWNELDTAFQRWQQEMQANDFQPVATYLYW